MIALVLCGLLAAVSAAPQYYHGSSHWPYHHYDPFSPYVRESMLDTHSLWSNLANEMQHLDNMMKELSLKFPSIINEGRVEGDKYQISIHLPGYEQKDINVKAKNGVLMVQANSAFNHYLKIQNLPWDVNSEGSWVYEKDVLKITFPLKQKQPEDSKRPVAEPTETTSTNVSREEMEFTTESNVRDVDVGLETAQKTNEIAKAVEATTYAVNIRDDAEFLPIPY
ncbi:uncharacterized protein LOC114250694 [Bombyx mandarina]|uniref:Heat shock protein 25.4 n=2 Tax=Bombyx TaxID=7090 RepID=B0ZT34_BOMMO|nr:heat shock protein 25.4 precursor [Bombyx mori]XP_028040473.1 uncharacterized protein LOC114250694 [Bombyx mandarina]ACA25336.1 heat shock protein 25.4 [Bombyx mori]